MLYLPFDIQMSAGYLKGLIQRCHKFTSSPRRVVESIRLQSGDNLGLSTYAFFGVSNLSFDHREN